MQLVIEIDEEFYKALKNNKAIVCGLRSGKTLIWTAVVNGTPLPKRHGRLGDLDKLKKRIEGGIKAAFYEDGYEKYGHINNLDDCIECIEWADTIIEAYHEPPIIEAESEG